MNRAHDWQPFYTAVVDDTTDQVDRLAEAFGDSLEYWLDGVLNYPPEDWQSEVRVFAAHWGHYGVEIELDSLVELGRVIQSRVERTGQFAREGEESTQAQHAPGGGGFFSVPDPLEPRKTSNAAVSKKAGKPPQGIGAAKPDRPRLPQQGEWIKGKPGDGVFKLNKPIALPDGQLVDKVPYRDGMPFFDQWQLKDGDVMIAITGSQSFDRAQGKTMWDAKHGGEFPKGFVLHHDGQVTQLVTHDGKQVFVGRMQAVPKALNDGVPHIGSASAARRYTLDSKLAAEVNKLAREGKGPLKALEKRFASMIAKQVKRASRVVPIVSGAVAILDFAENVEAHGVGGAIVRVAPLLGDLVAAYDLGRDVADSIVEQANEKLRRTYRDANEPVRQAHRAARKDTVEAFNEIAATLEVTKQFYRSDEIIRDLMEPMSEFYFTMYLVHFRETHGQPVEYYKGAKPGETTWVGPLEVQKQVAKDKLNRELRKKLQPAPPGPQT